MRAGGRRRVDRLVAAGAFGAALAGIVPAVALSDAAARGAVDPQVALALVRALEAGETRDFVIEYAYERTRAGVPGSFTAAVHEARRREAHLTRSGEVLTVDLPGERVTCDRRGEIPTCRAVPARATLPPSHVVAAALASGTYTAMRAGNETIAGERADCYDVVAALDVGAGAVAFPGLGVATRLCLASDGLILSFRTERIDATERQSARRVARGADAATLRPLLAGYEKVAPVRSR